MPHHHSLHYLEFPSHDLNATTAFFSQVFEWSFTPYGEEYVAFEAGDREGGIYYYDKVFSTQSGAPLVVFYSNNLSVSQQQIEEAGGVICKDTFSFPGGARFHFVAPGSGEFAIWSEKP